MSAENIDNLDRVMFPGMIDKWPEGQFDAMAYGLSDLEYAKLQGHRMIQQSGVSYPKAFLDALKLAMSVKEHQAIFHRVSQ